MKKKILGFSALMVLLVVGLGTALQLTQQEQEIRQQASTPSGQVELSMSVPTLHDGSTSSIDVFINTHGLQIDGIQAVMAITNPEQHSIPEVSIDFIEESGLIPIIAPTANLLPNGSGAQIYIVGISQNGINGVPFSSDAPVKFARINLLTKGENSDVSVNFDLAQSKATIASSNGQVEDLLKTPVSQTYKINPALVVEGINGTPTPTVPGIGGLTTLKTCNESCSSSAECQANLFCDQNRCRRANNPQDAYCAAPASSSQRSCNEYCADARDCESALTCYYNKCRSPQDLVDDTCNAAQPTSIPATPAVIAQGPTSGAKTTITIAPTGLSPFVQTVVDTAAEAKLTPTATAFPTSAITTTPIPVSQQGSSSSYIFYLLLFLTIIVGSIAGLMMYKKYHSESEMPLIDSELSTESEIPFQAKPTVLDEILSMEKPAETDGTSLKTKSAEPLFPTDDDSVTLPPTVKDSKTDTLDKHLDSIEDFFNKE